ncbi:MAG: DEAD/DEAH box helicase [Myxococcota bacterium]
MQTEAGGHTGESEARRALLGLAGRRLGSIPADLVVDHIGRIYPYEEAGWPVQRAALEAIVRRLRYAERDGLGVARRPRGGRYGRFACRRDGSRRTRPYETMLHAVEPLDASCDCPDFLRGSLGLCKHVLTVLADLADRGRLDALRQGGARPKGRRRPESPPARLTWDPVRPLMGPGDALGRVRWVSGRKPRGRLAEILVPAEDGSGGRGSWVVDGSRVDRPEGREAVVEALRAWVGRHADETDPAVRELLRGERERLDEAPRMTARNARRALRSMHRRLYPYQLEGVLRFLDGGRLLLADDMGLGKTAQAVAACHALYESGRVDRGLVVVPASLRLQWEREWRAFTDVPVQVIDGSPEQRRASYDTREPGFLIVGYEQLMRDLSHLLEWAPQMVVLDEAQRIKNWATKTAASVKRLRVPYRLVLTGTPLENRLEELASLMDWVDDHALEPKWRLEPWHTVSADGGRDVTGARNLDVLRARLAPVMVRRRRPDVLSQLPPRTDTVVPVPVTEAQATEHDELSLPIARLMQAGRRRPLTQAEFLKLMQLLTTQRIIANGLAQLRFESVWPSIRTVTRPDEALLSTLNAPKLLELRSLVEWLAVEQERKIVVFSQWRRMLTLAHWAVHPLLDEAGLRAAFFTGTEGQKRRMQNVVELHEDPSLRLLFATDAGGVGLNLQRAASVCINLDLPWNPAVLEQRIGRIYRLGQDEPIDVYNLVGQNCIEERIAGVVANKKALFTGLFDGTSDEVAFEESGSFLSRLEHVVQPVDPVLDEDDDETDPLEGPAPPGDEAPAGEEATLDDGAEPAAAMPPAWPAPEQVREALAGMRVQRTADGGMRIDADSEAAATLGALLEGLGHLLGSASAR